MNYIPESNEEYANVQYWNERYETEETYDWFKEYKEFRDIIKEIVKEEQKILMLGCGNSSMSEQMYRDGYRNIVNVDYSPVVIEKMKTHCNECACMEWLVMDVRNLQFADSTFDVVIEKGTLDAMLVGEKNPWRMSSKNEQLLTSILGRVRTVLKEHGRFISITFSQLQFRRKLLARTEFDWSFDYFTFGDTLKYFIYLMIKGEPLSETVLDALAPTTTPVRSEIAGNEVDDEEFLHNIRPDY